MSEELVNDQLADAKKVLKSQYDVQTEMLNHQQKAQLDILLKEKDRAIKTMSMQYEQQYTQQKLMIEQTHKQQENQLEMAKNQRDMAISQQAHQMLAQAQQYKMQVDMQKSMQEAYSSGFGAVDKKKDTKVADKKSTTPAKDTKKKVTK